MKPVSRDYKKKNVAYRQIPAWAWYSPLRTRDTAHVMMLSPWCSHSTGDALTVMLSLNWWCSHCDALTQLMMLSLNWWCSHCDALTVTNTQHTHPTGALVILLPLRLTRRSTKSPIYLVSRDQIYSRVCYQGDFHKISYIPSVCVECLIGKQKKPILFKVTEPSSIP